MTTHSPASRRPTLRAELDVLHDDYAEAINYAIAAGDDSRVRELAASYDDEATRLVAEREGKTHLLPLPRRIVRQRYSTGTLAASQLHRREATARATRS